MVVEDHIRVVSLEVFVLGLVIIIKNRPRIFASASQASTTPPPPSAGTSLGRAARCAPTCPSVAASGAPTPGWAVGRSTCPGRMGRSASRPRMLSLGEIQTIQPTGGARRASAFARTSPACAPWTAAGATGQSTAAAHSVVVEELVSRRGSVIGRGKWRRSFGVFFELIFCFFSAPKMVASTAWASASATRAALLSPATRRWGTFASSSAPPSPENR